MSMLSNLESVVTRKSKRVGRGYGSGKGAKSGRGTTRHQAARESIPLHFEGGQGRMVKKFPLIRGKGKNKSVMMAPVAIATGRLERFTDGDEITVETLVAHRILKSPISPERIKIVLGGTLTKKLVVKLPVSKGAQETIQKAGGSCDLS